MEEMADEYKGPHSVSIRRTSANRGTLQHVVEVAQTANGKLLVLAAGDDVSKPERARLLEQYWSRSGAWGLCSRFDCIGPDSEVLERDVRPPVLDNHGFGRFFYHDQGPVCVVHGCSSAYDIRIFSYFNLNPSDYILAEDGAISVLLNIIGKPIMYLDESLILYRETMDSLTNNLRKHSLSIKQIDVNEHRIERFARSQGNRCQLFLRFNEQPLPSVRKLNVDEVKGELARQEAISLWYQMQLYKRIQIMISGRLHWRWTAPRLFGRQFFYYLKWMVNRF